MGFNLSAIRKGIIKARQVATIPNAWPTSPAKRPTPIPIPIPMMPSDEKNMQQLVEQARAAGIDLICEKNGEIWDWRYTGGHLRDLAMTAFLHRAGARDEKTHHTVLQESIRHGNA
jgi:hypothetical protein